MDRQYEIKLVHHTPAEPRSDLSRDDLDHAWALVVWGDMDHAVWYYTNDDLTPTQALKKLLCP